MTTDEKLIRLREIEARWAAISPPDVPQQGREDVAWLIARVLELEEGVEYDNAHQEAFDRFHVEWNRERAEIITSVRAALRNVTPVADALHKADWEIRALAAKMAADGGDDDAATALRNGEP